MSTFGCLPLRPGPFCFCPVGAVRDIHLSQLCFLQQLDSIFRYKAVRQRRAGVLKAINAPLVSLHSLTVTPTSSLATSAATPAVTSTSSVRQKDIITVKARVVSSLSSDGIGNSSGSGSSYSMKALEADPYQKWILVKYDQQEISAFTAAAASSSFCSSPFPSSVSGSSVHDIRRLLQLQEMSEVMAGGSAIQSHFRLPILLTKIIGKEEAPSDDYYLEGSDSDSGSGGGGGDSAQQAVVLVMQVINLPPWLDLEQWQQQLNGNNNNNNSSSNSYLLYEYYSDVTLSRTLNHLEWLDKQTPSHHYTTATTPPTGLGAVGGFAEDEEVPLFVRLLKGGALAQQWARMTVSNCCLVSLSPSTVVVEEEVRRIAMQQLGMTHQQFEVAGTVLGRKLSLLQGPAGCGKTHFLAALILTWLQRHQQTNQPTVVILSAFTHSAIDNLIDKIQDLYTSSLACGTTHSTRRTTRTSSSSGSGGGSKLKTPFIARLLSPFDTSDKRERYNDSNVVKVINTDQLKWKRGTNPFNKLLYHSRQLLIAGSVWALQKLPSDTWAAATNLVIIEEATQMPLAHTCFPLHLLNQKTGQLLLVGVCNIVIKLLLLFPAVVPSRPL